MSTTPVANNYSIECPITLQNVIQQDFVVTIVLIVVQIVSTHYGPSLSFLDSSLESRQIDFMKGTVADLHVHLMAISLIVVQRIVLHT